MEVSAGFPQLKPVSSTPVPELRAYWRPRPTYLEIQESCGVKGPRGHSPGETGRWAPRESPGNLGPRHSGCSSLPGLLPWGLFLLTRAQVPRR